MVAVQDIVEYMEAQRDEVQRRVLMRFFKTGPGEYGEGDEFLGLKVPQTRTVVKLMAQDFDIEDVPELLQSRWHEVRLCGLLIMVYWFEKLNIRRLQSDVEAARKRERIVELYLQYSHCANNWDLVDLSAPKILGAWAMQGDRTQKTSALDSLAMSDNLWRQRMSIVSTLKPTQLGDPSWCLRYAEWHLHHKHDLIHKAVGWMLREMGKHVSMDLLRDFLRQHVHDMPRVTLRYAIERMDSVERQQWMKA